MNKRAPEAVFDNSYDGLQYAFRERAKTIDGKPAAEASCALAARTVRQWGAEWLDRRERSGVRAIVDDRIRWRVHVLEFAPWADAPLDSVTKLQAREWFAMLSLRRSSCPRHKSRKKRLAAQTLRNILNLVRRCFADAVEDELLSFNPFAALKLHRSRPASTIAKSTVLLPLEQLAGLGALALYAERWLVAFAMFSGVRQGEQWSLRLTDVTSDGPRLRVSLRFGSDASIEDGETDGPRKNGRVHVILLPPRAADALRRWLALLPSYAPHNPLGLVFPTRRGRRRCEGKNFRGWRFLEMAVGRHVRWHDLRHTFATSMCGGWWDDPWSLEELCAYLDHSSVKVTEGYARRVKELAHKAVARMAPLRLSMHVPVFARRPRARRRSTETRGNPVDKNNVDAATAASENAGNGAVAKRLGIGLQNREAPPEGGGAEEKDEDFVGTLEAPEALVDGRDRVRARAFSYAYPDPTIGAFARCLAAHRVESTGDWQRRLDLTTSRANENAEAHFGALKDCETLRAQLVTAQRRALDAEAMLQRSGEALAAHVFKNKGEENDGDDRSGGVRRVRESDSAGAQGAAALRGAAVGPASAEAEVFEAPRAAVSNVGESGAGSLRSGGVLREDSGAGGEGLSEEARDLYERCRHWVMTSLARHRSTDAEVGALVQFVRDERLDAVIGAPGFPAHRAVQPTAAPCDGCERVNEAFIAREDLLRLALDVLTWCSAASDFQEGGTAAVGWARCAMPVIRQLRRELGDGVQAASATDAVSGDGPSRSSVLEDGGDDSTERAPSSDPENPRGVLAADSPRTFALGDRVRLIAKYPCLAPVGSVGRIEHVWPAYDTKVAGRKPETYHVDDLTGPDGWTYPGIVADASVLDIVPTSPPIATAEELEREILRAQGRHAFGTSREAEDRGARLDAADHFAPVRPRGSRLAAALGPRPASAGPAPTPAEIEAAHREWTAHRASSPMYTGSVTGAVVPGHVVGCICVECEAVVARAMARVKADGVCRWCNRRIEDPACEHWVKTDAPIPTWRLRSVPDEAFRATELGRAATEKPTRPELAADADDGEERALLHLHREELETLARTRTFERDAARALLDAEKREHRHTFATLTLLKVQHRAAVGLLNDVDRAGARIATFLDAAVKT